jgi:hypothetical protein
MRGRFSLARRRHLTFTAYLGQNTQGSGFNAQGANGRTSQAEADIRASDARPGAEAVRTAREAGVVGPGAASEGAVGDIVVWDGCLRGPRL